MSTRLIDRLSALHEERLRTWPKNALDVNIGQREENVARYRNRVPEYLDKRAFEGGLLDLDGKTISRSSLGDPDLLVLLFFRFSECPACNVALPFYDEHLLPALERQRIPLLAVSPQVPERMRRIKERHNLRMLFASDSDNKLAHELGITFDFNAPSMDYYLSSGVNFSDELRSESWRLPHPSIFVVGADNRIVFADVAPDWMRRTEPEQVLDAIGAITDGHKAVDRKAREARS